MNFKRGDKVKILSKTQGRSIDEVRKSRNNTLKPKMWDQTGWVRDIESPNIIVVVYDPSSVSGGDYYRPEDLSLAYEIDKELFEL